MRLFFRIVFLTVFFIGPFFLAGTRPVSACGQCTRSTGQQNCTSYSCWQGSWVCVSYDQYECGWNQKTCTGHVSAGCRPLCYRDLDTGERVCDGETCWDGYDYEYDCSETRWCNGGCVAYDYQYNWGTCQNCTDNCESDPSQNGQSCGENSFCEGGSCKLSTGRSCDPQNAANRTTCGSDSCCSEAGTDPCLAHERTCGDINPPRQRECTTGTDCPNLSVEDACAGKACFVDKKCSADGQCLYGCIGDGTNCAGTGGSGGGDSGPAPTPPPSCSRTAWTDWSVCSGSPATKTRTNECGTVETANCTGTLQARAVIGRSSDNCAVIKASSVPLTGTTFQFTAGSASQQSPQTQNSNSYVTFSNIVGGSYTLAPTNPGNYQLTRACWVKTTNTPSSGEGLTQWLSVPTDSDTLSWDLGYTPLGPWSQAEGGMAYASGSLKSLLPTNISPRQFILSGSGGYPSLAVYGGDYDFDPAYNLTGEALVSQTNWLVNQSFPTKDWYDYYFRKLGGPPAPDSMPDQILMRKPESRARAYFLSGDTATSGDWRVADGENIILVVNGNLTINGEIATAPTGFVAFIVKGDIAVSSNVGGAYSSLTPVIRGLYITSPTGTFKTGTSSVVGKERLVLEGTFVAGNFLLQRDLKSVNANTTTPAELFIYDPSLAFRAPKNILDVPYVWQEVAP